MTAMTLHEHEQQEAAAFARTAAIEQRGKELAAEWLAEDPLQFIYYISEDSFSALDADLLRRWLLAPEGEAATSRLSESAARIFKNYINGYAQAKGLRVAENTRGLMDGFDEIAAKWGGVL